MIVTVPFTIDLDAGNGWLIAADIECRIVTTDGRSIDFVEVETSRYVPGKETQRRWIEVDRFTNTYDNPVLAMLKDVALREASRYVGDIPAAWAEADIEDRQPYDPFTSEAA